MPVKALRINRGGGDLAGEGGRRVGDRFFLGAHRHHGDAFGDAKNPFEGPVAGTDRQPVPGTARWFALEPGRPAAYAVPVDKVPTVSLTSSSSAGWAIPP